MSQGIMGHSVSIYEYQRLMATAEDLNRMLQHANAKIEELEKDTKEEAKCSDCSDLKKEIKALKAELEIAKTPVVEPKISNVTKFEE